MTRAAVRLMRGVMAVAVLAGPGLSACAPQDGAVGPDIAAASCLPDGLETRTGIPAGSYRIGGPVRYPEERPERSVATAGFHIDVHETTNAQFARFVAETGYVTVAERAPDPADHPDIDPDLLVPGSAVFGVASGGYWWRFIPGASWRTPYGPGSGIDGLDDYPVVHVAYADAQAYAEWAGADLPSEDEWEIAARGGTAGTDYAWGEEFRPDGQWRANTWQGPFPAIDTGADGFAGLAPVGCYPANPFGAYDMIGNVWEWTASPFDASGRSGTVRGGSFLCASSFCARFRPAARQPQEWDFSASHIGFRTIRREQAIAAPGTD